MYDPRRLEALTRGWLGKKLLVGAHPAWREGGARVDLCIPLMRAEDASVNRVDQCCHPAETPVLRVLGLQI